MAFSSGPPRLLRISVPLYPPREQAHPGLLYSLNRAEPSTYQQVRECWFTTLRELLWGAGQTELAAFETYKRSIVWICVYFPDARCRDIDNYTVKFISDALVALRVLEGDEHARTSLILEGRVDREDPRSEIFVLEDLGQLEQLKPKF